MPNGDENNIDLEGFAPSWLEDGGGVSGLSPRQAPFVEDTTDYILDPSTELPDLSDTSDNVQDDSVTTNSCLANAGPPPNSGTWILGSIGGTCQWIDTTVCP